MVMGMTTAGMVTMSELMNDSAIPSDPSAVS